MIEYLEPIPLSMRDRRTSERHKLIMYLRVHDQETDELIGHIVDLSSGGMMLVADEPFQPKSEHQLKLMLPNSEQAEQTIDIRAECCWCGPDANDSYFDAGFRFLGTTAELRETISSVVDDVGFSV